MKAQPRTGKGFAPRRHPVESGLKTRLTPSSVVPRKGRRGQPTGSYLCHGGLYLRPAQTYTPHEFAAKNIPAHRGVGVTTEPWSVPYPWGRPSTPPPSGKRCTRCQEWLPFSAFRPNRRVKSGWSSWCKDCQREAVRKWKAENPAYTERRRIPPARLTCSECGVAFEGRKDRLVCSRKCRDARYRRLHPDAYREKRKRKDARRRARARGEE